MPNTLYTPPVVNDQGNINVHKDEGGKILLELQSENGVEQDASAAPLFFICGEFRKALGADPTNPEGRMLVLTPMDLLTIIHGANFRVVDETTENMPVILWEGRIYKRG